MTVEIGFATTPEEIAACLEVRRQVFVIEQGVDAALEVDGRDDEAWHFMAKLNGEIVGTCRWLVDGGNVKMGRMSVLASARGHQIGTQLFGYMIDLMETDPKLKYARFGSQIRPMSLYARRGFVAVGERYFDAGLEHQDMERHFD